MQGSLDASNHKSKSTAPAPPRPLVATLLGGLAVFMMGGLVFGFNALKPIMYDEKVFQDACDGKYDDDGRGDDDDGSGGGGGVGQCSKQTLQLNLMYTVGIFNLSFIMIFFGMFMDSVG